MLVSLTFGGTAAAHPAATPAEMIACCGLASVSLPHPIAEPRYLVSV